MKAEKFEDGVVYSGKTVREALMSGDATIVGYFEESEGVSIWELSQTSPGEIIESIEDGYCFRFVDLSDAPLPSECDSISYRDLLPSPSRTTVGKSGGQFAFTDSDGRVIEEERAVISVVFS